MFQFSIVCRSEADMLALYEGVTLSPRPPAVTGLCQVPSVREKVRVSVTASENALHCRKPLHELINQVELQICTNTPSNVLLFDEIHCSRPTNKSLFTINPKAVHLPCTVKYRSLDLKNCFVY